MNHCTADRLPPTQHGDTYWRTAIRSALAGPSAFDRRYRREQVARAAFTLVELMVVVVILGVLATVVTISVNDYLVAGKQAAARSEISQLVSALELFYTENDTYPSNDEGLAQLKTASERHPNGILQGDLQDPWGNEYVYVHPGVHGVFDIVSYGADGQEGGTGADTDIVSWDLAGADKGGG